ncbi:TM0106 family RecB-like putative nuclease [Paraburkholderia elongata]|uniref:TM0106 family RecB-like putative nuclease n=1 Tax=Paraburkholderia elongata TaxID=2675747 RepID=A0A972SPP1_9BURK|nr:TM0106 family RecB-like putative nuclease [Paraburkholderia elongata]NPT62442.1 TM0106 family RecB-like putative nuclease [Paraburkholderia elongata]
MKITNEIITEYLNCKYKAYLLATEAVAECSDYEAFLHHQEAEYTRAATGALLGPHNRDLVACNKPITVDDLKGGTANIASVFIEDESLALNLQSLKRVPGESSLGPFHYEPVLFASLDGPSDETQRILLSIGARALEQLQHVRPRYGTVVSGNTYKSHRIDLDRVQVKAEKVVSEVSDILTGTTRPPLWLNEHCRVCRYQDRCDAEAHRTDDLSLLRRMSEREIRSYNRKGIATVGQLSHTFRFRRRGKRVKARGRPHSFPLQALALREQSVFVVSRPEVPKASTLIYIDMEGNASGGFVYLIGVLIVESGISRYQFFWAEDQNSETQLFRRFYEFITSIRNAHIFFYGSYEDRVFKRIMMLFQGGPTNNILTKCSTNVLSLIYSRIYFPTYSNELKEIAKYLGFEWSFPAATGLDSIIWRAKWEVAHDSATRDLIITYNKDDCLALQRVIEFLSSLPELDETVDSNEGGIRFVEQIKQEGNVGKFGKKPFAMNEFSEITERAYFDYQRDKIYIRTNASFKKIQSRKRRIKKQKSSLRPNKIVTLRAVVCPRCKGRNIYRDLSRFHARDSLDLRISTGGIKRWVIHYRTSYHCCIDCDRAFVPQTFRSKSRFGHGLMSWAIDQHVGNRVTFQNLEKTVKDYFSLPVDYTRFHAIKTYAAEFYLRTYNDLRRKLIRGSMIHVDETKIDLQKGSGYVWVMTNMEEVFYLYRNGREANFLHELLTGFNGVLISDFYAGYDSLPCPQQKCLMHLIRDINEDLLRYPFDQELKDVVEPLGKLIRSIIGTVDRFGLKSSHLCKHKNEVDAFLGAIEKRSPKSEIAGKYSKRILKYRSKLFTFLDFDGVPWNNNNAEHAIKPFAKYRQLTNGRVTEPGLKSYLILMSIYQTCKYKEIPFLDFMLSKERDIDNFAARR